MKVRRHDYIHDKLHDIPVPPSEDLERIWDALCDDRPFVQNLSAYSACLWLAQVSQFEPFVACMQYQAQLIKEANKL